jgi:tetratricopeptide (TPR) repeat protein
MQAEACTPIVFWLAVSTILACSIAILLSLTRAGVISMLVAGAMTLVVLRVKAPARSRIVTIASLLVAAIVLAVAWIGFETVSRRFVSITEATAGNWRGQMLRDLTQAWKRFPILGTGLGTHAVIFPMFDRSQISAVATHAENEYAQTLTETGAIGLLLALTFAVMIWVNYARAIRGRISSIGAIAIGLGYGFAAILIHSISDFGQHIPANATLTAITCGLLVSLARQRRDESRNIHAPREYLGSVPIRILVTASLLVGCAFAIYHAQRLYAAESEFSLARKIEDRLRQSNWQGDNNEFARMIIHAQNAHDIRPGNIDYAYWLAVYRWKWISVQPDAMTNPQYVGYARRIADELNSVRLTCPTFGLPACIAGQIELFVLHDPQGADDIRIGTELNPNDPTACFVAGQLAASEGKWDESLSRMEHYADITPGGAMEVVELYTRDFHRPDLALEVARNDAPALERLEHLVSQTSGNETVLSAAKNRAAELRLQIADRDGAGPGDLLFAAQIAGGRADHDRAIQYLRRAVAIDSSNPDLRYELATHYHAKALDKDALRELHAALGLRHDFPEARELLQQLEK